MTLKQRLRRKTIHFLQAVLYVVFSTVGIVSWLRRLGHAVAPLNPAKVRRILVIRIDLLGDVVLSMPAVEALREAYPHAHIAMLVLPFTRQIPASNPAVDEVITLDTNRLRPGTMRRDGIVRCLREGLADWAQALGRLRGGQFDLCVSLCGLMASILAFASGAPHRVGYREESYPFLFTHPVPGRRYKRVQHEVLYCLDLARAAGAPGGDRVPSLRPDHGAGGAARDLLAREGLAPGQPYVVIHAGATNGSAKRWPARHWAALADLLQDDLGLAVVLTGSNGDRLLAEEVAGGTRARPLLLTGRTTIAELAGVLQGATAVLSGDSGPLHMAVALGRPTVSLYGPTDPRLSGPHPGPAQPAVVLRKGIFCSPCYNHYETAECRFGNPVCMIDITPREVLAATRRVLDANEPSRAAAGATPAPGPRP
ncbi:MAG: lipopolysaccharide heptosyltransferase II [Chloroflexota bacterium]